MWRRFPLHIDFRREARWLNEEAWVFTDTTTFATGFSIVRPMVCTIEDGTRVRVVADDMPGGAELNLTEGGYRVRPYRFSYPLGPVRFTFTCHDRVRENADGSLDWTIVFRWLGLPMVRLSGTVSPVEEATA